MTTVVAMRGQMWADTHITASDVPNFRSVKLFRAGKTIVGTCGDCDLGNLFLAWLRGDHKSRKRFLKLADEDGREFEALVIDGTKIALWGIDLIPDIVVDEYYAIGSGAKYALASMDHGKNPHDAIVYASSRDNYTKPPVTTMVITSRK